MPKISVILPFFNAQKSLKRAILSIQQQLEEDYECILVDNNSTDSSMEIAHSFCKGDRRFKLFAEKKQGVTFASNKAEKMANGRYIARMDADDVSLPIRLKEQAHFLDTHSNIGIVSGQVKYIPHSERTAGFAKYVSFINRINETHEIYLKQFMESPLINPSTMWRRELSLKFGAYKSGEFPEDYEKWLRWFANGVKAAKIPQTVLEWYDSENRLTRTDPLYSDAAFYKIKSRYLAQWLKENNPHYPYVAVWGASRKSRLRARYLENEGIEIRYYIDISLKRKLSKPLKTHEQLEPKEQVFILVYIGQEKARSEIEAFLMQKGFKEGVHFLFVT